MVTLLENLQVSCNLQRYHHAEVDGDPKMNASMSLCSSDLWPCKPSYIYGPATNVLATKTLLLGINAPNTKML